MSGCGRRFWCFGLVVLGLAPAGLAGAQEVVTVGQDPKAPVQDAALEVAGDHAIREARPGAAGVLEEVLPGALAGSAWGTAVLIESGAGQAYAPQIAMGANGHAFAVWWQSDGSGDRVWANRHTVATGWGTAEIIQTSGFGILSPSAPQIAVDATGNALAVWEEGDPGSTNMTSIWANRYTAGTGWGTAQLIESGADAAYAPQIGFDGNGDALAVWVQNSWSLHYIWANRYTAGTGWGTAVQIENVSAYPPQIAVDATGNALAVWAQYNGAIAANRYTAGTGWGTAASIVTSGRDPQIAMNASGSAFVVWDTYDSVNGNFSIWSKRYIVGGSVGAGWQPDELIDPNIDMGSGAPQVAVDGDGDAFAVWSRFDGARYHIHAVKHPAATNWGVVVRIDSDTGSAGAPQIAVNANGDAFAVWYQHDGTRYNIWSNRRLATDTGWGTAELVETDNAGSAYDPQIVVAPSGKALSVWRQHDGTRDNIWASLHADRIFKDGFE